jgi:hypothetical protein
MAGQGHIRQGRVCRKCGGTERNANGQCAEGAPVLITKPMATRCASTTAHTMQPTATSYSSASAHRNWTARSGARAISVLGPRMWRAEQPAIGSESGAHRSCAGRFAYRSPPIFSEAFLTIDRRPSSFGEDVPRPASGSYSIYQPSMECAWVTHALCVTVSVPPVYRRKACERETNSCDTSS